MSQHRRTSRHPLSMTLHQTWTHLGLGASLKSLDHFSIEVNSGLKKKIEIEKRKQDYKKHSIIPSFVLMYTRIISISLS